MSFGFVLLFAVFKAVGKYKISLTEIVQQGIHNGADCHFAVCSDLGTATEGEETVDILVIQKEFCHHGGNEVIGDPITNQNLNGKTDALLRGCLDPGEDHILTSQEPDDAT